MDEIVSREFYNDLSSIIESASKSAYQMVDRILVIRNWLLGKRIAEEELSGTHAERYGEKIVSELARTLTKQYGKGFDKTSLYRYIKFYKIFPKIVATVSQLSLADVTGYKLQKGVALCYSSRIVVTKNYREFRLNNMN